MSDTTCELIDSGRQVSGGWSVSIDGIPAGSDVGAAGITWDEHPAGSGDRPGQAQDERASVGGWVTTDVPDVHDRDELAFDRSYSPWPGGPFTVEWLTGSGGVLVNVCWTPPPVTTLPELVTTTTAAPTTTVAPSTTVDLGTPEPEVTIPPVVATEPTVTLGPPPTVPLPDGVWGVEETTTTVAAVDAVVLVEQAPATLPATGAGAVAPLVSGGVVFLLLGAFAFVAVRRPRRA